ncbi:peroxiredoxin [Halorientalis pallida]|uniref:peroxiredoxin n=1 Tax=Halorientalis pallida TaxID=2479928 RepID=UPI003C6FB1A4
MLDAGDAAPDIEAQNQDGETVTPTFAEPTVVYFYPRDGTPGCQLEARQFQDELPQFRDLGATVYGVSTDDVDSHREFADEEALDFDLLADPGGEVAAAFGLDTEGGYVERITFVLADGAVQAVVDADDVNPDGHAAAVREQVATL